MISILIANMAVVAGWMLLFWLVSLPTRNVGLVDIGWGPGFALIAWTTFLQHSPGEHFLSSSWLAVLTTLWAVRLGGYLAWRNLGHDEDKRYAAMRAAHEPGFWWKSLGYVFGLQGVIMWIISLPLQFASGRPVGLMPVAFLGTAVWVIGLTFEALGDWQLARFRANPANRGQVMDRGLWRYTRHPNYFGDCCIWWGLWLTAFAAGAPWWTLISPALMTVLLLRFSGVTLLESSLRSEKPAFAAYAARTSAFIPWPPRRT